MTAFLGYSISPKWFILNLNFLDIFLNKSVIYFTTNLFLTLFIISFIIFNLDDFKLSTNTLKYLQITSFLILPFVLIFVTLSTINFIDFICYAKDDINLHAHVNVTKDAAIEISKGMSTIGTQLGLGATMVGVSTAVGKALVKSGMPPLQKAGLIVGSGLTAGLGHSIISTLNRNQVLSENIDKSNLVPNSTNISKNISKFLDDSQSSPLQDLLFQFEAINYVCLSLIYILIIQLVFKLYFIDNINLNLSKLLGNNINDKMEYYLNKIIKLNKQMSVVWIWFGFIVLAFGLAISVYAIHNVYLDMNSFINVHNRFKFNSINSDIYITNKSIEYTLFNLLCISYMPIVILIYLMITVACKLHFENSMKLNLSLLGVKINNGLNYFLNKVICLFKNMNNIYILLMLVSLMLTLAFSAYILKELYSNLNYYIVVENNIRILVIFNRNTCKTMCNNKNNLSFNRKNSTSYYPEEKGNNFLCKYLTENKLKPIYSYENLHYDETRKMMLKDLVKLSGIYLIFNKITSDYYIGSASTGKFYSRFSNHLLYFKGSKILKHAVRKYGLNNFSFSVLELFPEIVNKENNKKLLNMEDFYLKYLLPNYNILTEAGSSFGYKHTELSRIKINTNYSRYRLQLIGDLNKGKTLSEDTIYNIREKKSLSDQALNMKKKSKAIILYNLDKTVFGEYPSIVEAARSINCNEKTINRTLKTNKKVLKRRFIVKISEEK